MDLYVACCVTVTFIPDKKEWKITACAGGQQIIIRLQFAQEKEECHAEIILMI